MTHSRARRDNQCKCCHQWNWIRRPIRYREAKLHSGKSIGSYIYPLYCFSLTPSLSSFHLVSFAFAWRRSFSISFSAGSWMMYFLRFFCLKMLYCLPFLYCQGIESYSRLLLLSFSTLKVSSHCLLAPILSVEKSPVSLTDFCLFFWLFKIFFLFFVCQKFPIMCLGDVIYIYILPIHWKISKIYIHSFSCVRFVKLPGSVAWCLLSFWKIIGDYVFKYRFALFFKSFLPLGLQLHCFSRIYHSLFCILHGFFPRSLFPRFSIGRII